MTLRMVEAAAAVKARDLMTDDGDWITGANNRLLADDWVEGVTRWHGLGGGPLRTDADMAEPYRIVCLCQSLFEQVKVELQSLMQ